MGNTWGGNGTMAGGGRRPGYATGNGLQAFDLDTYAYRPSSATAAGTTTTRKTPTELRVIDLRHGSDGYGSDVYALLPTR